MNRDTRSQCTYVLCRQITTDLESLLKATTISSCQLPLTNLNGSTTRRTVSPPPRWLKKRVASHIKANQESSFDSSSSVRFLFCCRPPVATAEGGIARDLCGNVPKKPFYRNLLRCTFREHPPSGTQRTFGFRPNLQSAFNTKNAQPWLRLNPDPNIEIGRRTHTCHMCHPYIPVTSFVPLHPATPRSPSAREESPPRGWGRPRLPRLVGDTDAADPARGTTAGAEKTVPMLVLIECRFRSGFRLRYCRQS